MKTFAATILIAGALAATACSRKTNDEASDTANSAVMDLDNTSNEAVIDTDAALANTGDAVANGADAVGNAADNAADAIRN